MIEGICRLCKEANLSLPPPCAGSEGRSLLSSSPAVRGICLVMTAMARLEATSELQSRLSSLSFSSFPGVTSHHCDSEPPGSLQSTNLTESFTQSSNQGSMNETKEDLAKGNEEAPAELALGEGGKENNSAGTCQLSAEIKEAAQMPTLPPPTTWTSAAVKELKAKFRTEKDSVVTVYRGDIMTVHVPTVPEAKKVCWEFATDGFDIGFGIYFDWTPVTSRSITVHISESSDDEDEEEELEGPLSNDDIEKGSKNQTNSNLTEILPVYRQDSHLSVQGGSHEFPGEGTYLLKFDNSYSLWRNKTLYYRVYYSA